MNRWTDQFLDSMREMTDSLADNVVDELFSSGEIGAVNSLMSELIKNDQPIPDKLPKSVRDFLEQSGALPQWADMKKIRQAEEFFARNGLLICMSLTCASLPRCYACAKGVQALYLTGRLSLETDAKRRIGETGQMIINVMAPGGIVVGGSGVRDAQKVRLMHAAVRHLIQKSGQWDPAWGQPINQEDMAGTLLTFSCTPLDCLRRLGVPFESEEGDAYIHAWNVIGHILGLDQQMYVENLDDAGILLDRIGQRHFRTCEAGIEMTKALIDLLDDMMPGTVFKGFPKTMIRFLLGDEIADIIGLPKSDLTKILIGPMGKIFGLIERLEEHSQMLAKAGECFGREFNQALSWVARGGHRAPYSIPTVLRERWNLRPVN